MISRHGDIISQSLGLLFTYLFSIDFRVLLTLSTKPLVFRWNRADFSCFPSHTLHYTPNSWDKKCDPQSDNISFGKPTLLNTGNSCRGTLLSSAFDGATASEHRAAKSTTTNKNLFPLWVGLGKGPVISMATLKKCFSDY